MIKTIAACFLVLAALVAPSPASAKDKIKLYWFIPDGVRAEPDLFDVFKWAREGKLPNIKKMMDRGSYGYSKPVFPSHTPINFATLLTGTMPKTHGVADGPMHVEGRELSGVSIGGFSSVARKVPAAWSTMDQSGLKVLMMSMPGSTPPEIEKGIIVRGRWGGWGADFHGVNFESKGSGQRRYEQGRASRLFFFGPELTKYLDPAPAVDWKRAPRSFNPALETTLLAWGATYYALLTDGTDDHVVNYDLVSFSKDKDALLASLRPGEWSGWNDSVLRWNGKEVPSAAMFHVIKLDKDGSFKLRVLFNGVNRYNTQPPSVAEDLTKAVGPMVDFVDNFPAQLIRDPEDKKTFLDELEKSFDWHIRSIAYVRKQYDPDVVFDDIYSPNQMLTSRWWLGYVDPASKRYGDVTPEQRAVLWNEVQAMYKRLDDLIGEILRTTGPDTVVVFSSDHGAVPLDRWIRVNNLLAERGWLKVAVDPVTGFPEIDWKNSKAVFLKMTGIYVHPDGLAGPWKRGSGPAYERLREEVRVALLGLKDESGVSPITSAVRWEDAERLLDIPADRSGDLIVSNKAGYGFNEETTDDRRLFEASLITGYKQAIGADETNALWTPFLIMGPGIKKGFSLPKPISHIDQLPTILTAMGIKVPAVVEGRILPVLK